MISRCYTGLSRTYLGLPGVWVVGICPFVSPSSLCTASSACGKGFLGGRKLLQNEANRHYVQKRRFFAPKPAFKHDTGMHRALLVVEIIRLIFSFVFHNKCHHSCTCVGSQSAYRTLAYLARTCRAFHEPAIDLLWMNLDSGLDPLIKLMPRRMWAKRHYPLGKHWFVFQKYASRVKSIRMPHHKLRPTSVYRVIAAIACSSKAALPLFPNLTRIILCDPNLFPLLRHMIGLSVTDIILQLDLWPLSVFEMSVIADLPKLCPNVTSFTIQCVRNPSLEFWDIIGRWTSLRHIQSFPLPQQAMDQLGSRGVLQSFTVDLLTPYLHPHHAGTLPGTLHTLILGGGNAGVCTHYLDGVYGSPSALVLCIKDVGSTISTNNDDDNEMFTISSEGHSFYSFSAHRNEDDDSTITGDGVSTTEDDNPNVDGDVCELLRTLPNRFNNAALYSLSIKLICEYRTLLNHGALQLQLGILRPLFDFRSLRIVDIGLVCTALLDDDAFAEIARVWPNLESLALRTSNLSKVRPQATIRSIISFLEYCPNLNTLHLVFDGTKKVETFTEVVNTRMTTLKVGHSPIEDVDRMVMCLRALMPNLREVVPDYWTWRHEGAITQWEQVQERLTLSLRSHPRIV
ncbi:hypothetical protein J3A83DRAFT_3500126 [Scleroderma citrinum]